MLPDKISITTIQKVDGELKEVTKEYFYKFNFNAINAFRKSEGIDFEEFTSVFAGLNPDVIKDEEGNVIETKMNKKYFDSFEAVCKLFLFAIEEGSRMAREEVDITVEDITDFLNDDSQRFADVVNEFSESQGDKKKVNQKEAVKS